jgi:16S rRNA (uracil1498-N3)-methyltransferase
MKSIRIYQPGQFEKGSAYPLDKISSHHLIKVLRLKNNYIFKLFNGVGIEHTVKLEISGKIAIAHIQDTNLCNNESNLKIHLLQGISKGNRMDFAIQKSVELGVTSITPVITERTAVNLKADREQKKLQHWRAIAISACEQSGRSFLPEIHSICHLPQAITSYSNDLKLLLDPVSETHLNSLTAKDKIQILIGPEGGLSENEIQLAKNNGFESIKLGPRILRTETAALTAIASAQLLWGDLGK